MTDDSPVLPVVVQLCNLFCGGDFDVFERLVDGRGLSADEAAGALRSAGIYSWQPPPQESWFEGDVEQTENDDGTWTVSVPVWSDGEQTGARLVFRVEDPFGDGLYEPYVEAVEV